MIKVCPANEKEQWDSIVHSFPDHDVYYLSGYVNGFKTHGDGEPLLFYYERDGLRGINVVMKRDIAKSPIFENRLPENTYFDFSTPYGYGGWIFEGSIEKTSDAFSEYKRWCRNNSIISEFVRFHPVLNNDTFAKNFYDVVTLGNTVCLDISDPKIIWSNITSKNRNIIRKAEKSGVEIFQSKDWEIYRNFIDIYNQTMDRDNADSYYYFSENFYKSIFTDMPDNSRIFYAVKDNKIIAASIILSQNLKLSYHLSGSLFEYRTFAPTNLLLYKAALWGCETGCKTFHLGGGVGSGEDSLFKFKKSFYRNDDLPFFSIGKKIFDKQKYDLLVDMREETNSNYFPKYRAK